MPGLQMAIELQSPVQAHLAAYVAANRVVRPTRMVKPNTRTGRSLAICGAGPSLASASFDGLDDIWACNSALPYLLARGVPVTEGVGVDQTVGLVREWTPAPDVPYLLASSCDPSLAEMLRAQGRTIQWFHNHVGFTENELDVYATTWPPALMVGEGFSVVSRSIGLAFWMGYERVDIIGADCCFAANDLAHANGDTAVEAYTTPLIMSWTDDRGRVWRTRPDMLMDAVHLVRRVRAAHGRIRLVGDTFPVSLLGKDDAFLDLICRRIPQGDLAPVSS